MSGNCISPNLCQCDLNMFIELSILCRLLETNKMFRFKNSCFHLCIRHTLMHLFFSDIQKALDNIEKSGSEFLLMTTQSNEKNQELSSGLLGRGRYRPVNFFKQPFSFPSPVCIGKDTNEPNMFIVLYNIKSIHSIQATNN